MNEVLLWLSANKVEFFATILSLIYLYFSIKQKTVSWFFGIFGASLYAYVFFDSQLYALMSLQFYYVSISVYGLYNWYIKNKETDNNFKISFAFKNKKIVRNLLNFSILIYIFIFFLLSKFSKESINELIYLESFVTSLSIISVWMLTRKMIETWIMWIIIDTVSIGLYFYKELYFTTFLFVVYTIASIIAYIKWKKIAYHQK